MFVSSSSNTWLPRAPSTVGASRFSAAEVAGQRDRAALRAQVAVPDHLGQPDRHRERPPCSRSQRRLEPSEGEVEAGVVRMVVVAEQRRRAGHVVVAALVEVAADAQLEAADTDLQPRRRASAPATPSTKTSGAWKMSCVHSSRTRPSSLNWMRFSL